MKMGWDWNYDWKWDRMQGPRGPMHVRGKRARHRLSGGWLFALFGLLIGFRVVMAALGIVFVAVCSIAYALTSALGDVFSAIGSVFSGLFAGSGKAGGVAIGIAIGVLLYRMLKARKERYENAKAEEKKETEETFDYAGEHSIRNYYG